jgi:hypothetical protein
MIAAGLPFQALSPWGREAQSIAFFNTPDTDQLYSGVTNKIAFTSRMRLFNSVTFGRWILLVVLIKRRYAIKLERFDSYAFRRKFSCSPQRRAIV